MIDSVLRDPYLRALYDTAFSSITNYLPEERNTLIEIGAGDGLSKQFLPKAFLTDIAFHKNLDSICTAHELPFKSASVDALVLKDSLHHLPDVELFLNEAHRVLRVGGRVVVFDPYWGLLAKFVYRFIHQEEFDQNTISWNFQSDSPWDSNQALSYLLLRRDRDRFEQLFPFFDICEHEVLIGPSFLLSGGVSRRTVVSGRFLRILLRLEMRQSKWFDSLCFFHVFSLTKTL
jgi:SAM-dependent methyltransferase